MRVARVDPCRRVDLPKEPFSSGGFLKLRALGWPLEGINYRDVRAASKSKDLLGELERPGQSDAGGISCAFFEGDTMKLRTAKASLSYRGHG